VLRASVLVVVACAACTGLGSCVVACAVGIGENFRGSAVSKQVRFRIRSDSGGPRPARAARESPRAKFWIRAGQNRVAWRSFRNWWGPSPPPTSPPEDGGGEQLFGKFSENGREMFGTAGGPLPHPSPGGQGEEMLRKC